MSELLTLVGLDKSAAKKRVRQYSLGMRQRLGLAHALLGDPQVLILDEPANGLDPEGIRWMRGLLRDFADRGGTVFLSSHLLGEVEAVADRLLIIGNGKIVADGTREELLAGTGVQVRATDPRELENALHSAGLTAQHLDDDSYVVDADAETVGRAALIGGVVLTHLAPSEGAGLETPSSSSRRPPHEPRRFLPAPHVRRAAQDGRHSRRLLAAADDRRLHARDRDPVLHLRRDRRPDLP